MDETRPETEYERVVRRMDEAKYSRVNGRAPVRSMEKGADLAPIFWIVFFVLAFLVLLYLGSATEG